MGCKQPSRLGVRLKNSASNSPQRVNGVRGAEARESVSECTTQSFVSAERHVAVSSVRGKELLPSAFQFIARIFACKNESLHREVCLQRNDSSFLDLELRFLHIRGAKCKLCRA